MRFLFITLVATTITLSAYAGKLTIDDISRRLSDIEQFSATVDYDILLPSADDPIVYHLELQSRLSSSDSLAPAEYLIDWSTEGRGGSKGFTAYYDGNFYRFRDFKLQESHFCDEPAAFTLGNGNMHGIQNQSQFSELLPQYMARDLAGYIGDSTYKYCIWPDTVISGEKVVALKGIRSYKDLVANTFLYTFDKKTLLPLSIERTSNPGNVSEQIVSARFSYGNQTSATPLSDNYLIDRYPEAFDKYRQANFSFDNLPGRHMPRFSLPTPSGERYGLDAENRFVRPVVIAMLKVDDKNTPQLIANLRRARESRNADLTLLFVFIDNNSECISEAAGKLFANEHLLMSGRGLAGELGVDSTPAVIACDSDGTIVAVTQSSDNNSIENVVIELMAQASNNNL